MLLSLFLYVSLFRLVILRVTALGLLTIDLQCCEGDNIAQIDNVGDERKNNCLCTGPANIQSQ